MAPRLRNKPTDSPLADPSVYVRENRRSRRNTPGKSPPPASSRPLTQTTGNNRVTKRAPKKTAAKKATGTAPAKKGTKKRVTKPSTTAAIPEDEATASDVSNTTTRPEPTPSIADNSDGEVDDLIQVTAKVQANDIPITRRLRSFKGLPTPEQPAQDEDFQPRVKEEAVIQAFEATLCAEEAEPLHTTENVTNTLSSNENVEEPAFAPVDNSPVTSGTDVPALDATTTNSTPDLTIEPLSDNESIVDLEPLAVPGQDIFGVEQHHDEHKEEIASDNLSFADIPTRQSSPSLPSPPAAQELVHQSIEYDDDVEMLDWHAEASPASSVDSWHTARTSPSPCPSPAVVPDTTVRTYTDGAVQTDNSGPAYGDAAVDAPEYENEVLPDWTRDSRYKSSSFAFFQRLSHLRSAARLFCERTSAFSDDVRVFFEQNVPNPMREGRGWTVLTAAQFKMFGDIATEEILQQRHEDLMRRNSQRQESARKALYRTDKLLAELGKKRRLLAPAVKEDGQARQRPPRIRDLGMSLGHRGPTYTPNGWIPDPRDAEQAVDEHTEVQEEVVPQTTNIITAPEQGAVAHIEVQEEVAPQSANIVTPPRSNIVQDKSAPVTPDHDQPDGRTSSAQDTPTRTASWTSSFRSSLSGISSILISPFKRAPGSPPVPKKQSVPKKTTKAARQQAMAHQADLEAQQAATSAITEGAKTAVAAAADMKREIEKAKAERDMQDKPENTTPPKSAKRKLPNGPGNTPHSKKLRKMMLSGPVHDTANGGDADDEDDFTEVASIPRGTVHSASAPVSHSRDQSVQGVTRPAFKSSYGLDYDAFSSSDEEHKDAPPAKRVKRNVTFTEPEKVSLTTPPKGSDLERMQARRPPGSVWRAGEMFRGDHDVQGVLKKSGYKQPYNATPMHPSNEQKKKEPEWLLDARSSVNNPADFNPRGSFSVDMCIPASDEDSDEEQPKEQPKKQPKVQPKASTEFTIKGCAAMKKTADKPEPATRNVTNVQPEPAVRPVAEPKPAAAPQSAPAHSEAPPAAPHPAHAALPTNGPLAYGARRHGWIDKFASKQPSRLREIETLTNSPPTKPESTSIATQQKPEAINNTLRDSLSLKDVNTHLKASVSMRVSLHDFSSSVAQSPNALLRASIGSGSLLNTPVDKSLVDQKVFDQFWDVHGDSITNAIRTNIPGMVDRTP